MQDTMDKEVTIQSRLACAMLGQTIRDYCLDASLHRDIEAGRELAKGRDKIRSNLMKKSNITYRETLAIILVLDDELTNCQYNQIKDNRFYQDTAEKWLFSDIKTTLSLTDCLSMIGSYLRFYDVVPFDFMDFGPEAIRASIRNNPESLVDAVKGLTDIMARPERSKITEHSVFAEVDYSGPFYSEMGADGEYDEGNEIPSFDTVNEGVETEEAAA